MQSASIGYGFLKTILLIQFPTGCLNMKVLSVISIEFSIITLWENYKQRTTQVKFNLQICFIW